MKRVVAVLGLLAALLAGIGALLFIAHSGPSTTEIDDDLAKVYKQIKSAEVENAS
jgi:hypothetical protein